MCFVLEQNDESVSATVPWCRLNVNCVKVLKVQPQLQEIEVSVFQFMAFIMSPKQDILKELVNNTIPTN